MCLVKTFRKNKHKFYGLNNYIYVCTYKASNYP